MELVCKAVNTHSDGQDILYRHTYTRTDTCCGRAGRPSVRLSCPNIGCRASEKTNTSDLISRYVHTERQFDMIYTGYIQTSQVIYPHSLHAHRLASYC